MTDPLTRIRAAALDLPETEERLFRDEPAFFVAGEPFARFLDHFYGNDAPVLCFRTSGAEEAAALLESASSIYVQPADSPEGWMGIDLAGDADWALIDDHIARSWELAAPRRLLEAGGR